MVSDREDLKKFYRRRRVAPSPGAHGRPMRSSIQARISRRTTWDGVRSSAAHNLSKAAFLRGSISTVSLAVRRSVGIYISRIQNDNQSVIGLAIRRKR